MSVKQTISCDRCGGDCGNGGVMDSLVVSDLNTATGMVLNFHFCRGRIDADGHKHKGCDESVLTKRNLQHFLEEEEEMYERPVTRETPAEPEPQESIESPSEV